MFLHLTLSWPWPMTLTKLCSNIVLCAINFEVIWVVADRKNTCGKHIIVPMLKGRVISRKTWSLAKNIHFYKIAKNIFTQKRPSFSERHRSVVSCVWLCQNNSHVNPGIRGMARQSRDTHENRSFHEVISYALNIITHLSLMCAPS